MTETSNKTDQPEEVVDLEKQALELLAAPKRILLVEDEEVIRTLMRRLCQGYNVTLTEAASGEQAMELLGTETYDIVLLDIMLGEVSGADLFRTMRQVGDDTPVIIISGHLTEAIIREITEIDFSCFVLKPGHLNERFAGGVMRTLGVKKLPSKSKGV